MEACFGLVEALVSGVAPAGAPPTPIETDPAIVAGLIERGQASIAALERDIRTPSLHHPPCRQEGKGGQKPGRFGGHCR